MAHINNKAFYILDADASPTFTPSGGDDAGVAMVKNTEILYFHDGGGPWTSIDIGALSSADGAPHTVIAGNTTTGVAPTAGQVSSPISGDNAIKYLSDGTTERWVYTAAWALAYTLDPAEVSNLAVGTVTSTVAPITNSNGTGFNLPVATASLAGIILAADKAKLGFITVTQAVDLDAMETAIAAVVIDTVSDTNSVDVAIDGSKDLTATVKLSATQDKLNAVTISGDGLRVTKATLSAYATYALGNAAVAVGEYYLLTKTNLEGVPSDGVSFPEVRRTV